MHNPYLLVAVVLMWIIVVAGILQRISTVQALSGSNANDISSRTSSLNGIEKFWMVLYFGLLVYLLILLGEEWESGDTKTHLIGAIICYGIAGALFALQLINRQRILALKTKDPEAGQNLRKWVSVGNVLLIFAAVFLSIAYRHS
ncbi:MAG: hypothetical protein C5B52_06470 [Bacteroidetes bacterium]|nr:MAG: hypothetical protein C5B52_06470 [Bacteroidota bacterium]